MTNVNYYSVLIYLLISLSGCVGKKERQVLVSTVGAEAESVYLTSDGENRPVIAWTEKSNEEVKFFYARISKSGNVKDKRIAIPVPADISTHAEGMPKVAFKSDGTVIAAYETKTPTKENKYAGAIFFTESRDQGNTWSAPAYIHSDTIAGRSRSFFDLDRLSDGQVGAAWLDIKLKKSKGGRSIRFSRTMDGAGFVNEVLVDSSACECCRIDLYSNNDGPINISYRGMKKGIMGQFVRDIMHTVSKDNGATFSEAQRLSADNWIIDGCPHTGPSLCGANNSLHALWYSEGGSTGIFYSVSNGKNFSPRESVSFSGKHPQMTAIEDNLLLVWEESTGNGVESSNRIRCQLRSGMDLSSSYLSPDGVDAFFPVVTTTEDKFLVAYLMKEKGMTGVYVYSFQ